MFERIVVAVGDTSNPNLQKAAGLLRETAGEVQPFHAASRRPGETLDGLLAHVTEWHADLLVVGARSHVLARRAAMLAPCSVLMVPEDAALSLNQLLVPVDFSEASAEAVREAARIAAGCQGEVTVVAIESDEDPWLDWEDDPEQPQKRLGEFVDEAAGKDHGFRCIVEPEHSLTPGARAGRGGLDGLEGARTAASIVAVADRLGSTLIVAGTRGRTQAAAIFLGSVVEKVIQHSRLPVLAVKRHGEQLSLLEGLIARLRDHHQLVAS